METVLIACLYLAPLFIAFGLMGWVADYLEERYQAKGEK